MWIISASGWLFKKKPVTMFADALRSLLTINPFNQGSYLVLETHSLIMVRTFITQTDSQAWHSGHFARGMGGSDVTVCCFNIKGKGQPRTGQEGSDGEYKYSSTLSLTSALGVGGWSTPHPGRFTPGKTRYPFYRRLERLRKISSPPWFDPRLFP
jgi:hypothetical protein